jgi:DNA-binding transcriptional ArsR family regulator
MLKERGELLANMHQTLADPTRRTILEELSRRGDQSLFEIMARLVERHQLSISRQAISKHLKALEDADLIETVWSGRTKLHTSRIANNKDLLIRWLEDIMPKEDRSKR